MTEDARTNELIAIGMRVALSGVMKLIESEPTISAGAISRTASDFYASLERDPAGEVAKFRREVVKKLKDHGEQ